MAVNPRYIPPVIDFLPMVGRVALIVQPHEFATVYELEIDATDRIFTEFARVLSAARQLTAAAPQGPERAPPPPPLGV